MSCQPMWWTGMFDGVLGACAIVVSLVGTAMVVYSVRDRRTAGARRAAPPRRRRVMAIAGKFRTHKAARLALHAAAKRVPQ